MCSNLAVAEHSECWVHRVPSCGSRRGSSWFGSVGVVTGQGRRRGAEPGWARSEHGGGGGRARPPHIALSAAGAGRSRRTP